MNALAQAAGVAALADDAHLQRSLSELTEAKGQLVDALSEQGRQPLPQPCTSFWSTSEMVQPFARGYFGVEFWCEIVPPSDCRLTCVSRRAGPRRINGY